MVVTSSVVTTRTTCSSSRDTGEIVAVDKDGTSVQVWNAAKAAALTLTPWGPCKRISAEIVRGKMICVNGALNDKPLEINDLVANYLG